MGFKHCAIWNISILILKDKSQIRLKIFGFSNNNIIDIKLFLILNVKNLKQLNFVFLKNNQL